jgi:hypothetical protein
MEQHVHQRSKNYDDDYTVILVRTNERKKGHFVVDKNDFLLRKYST